jgi:bacteriophage N4 adsorption protein B
MSLEDLLPYFLVFVKLLLVVVSIVFLVSGLDDLFIDAYYIVRSIYRRLFVARKYQPLTAEHLLQPIEQPIAVMIPAWDESAVVRRMLENTVQTVNYSNYQIFVGTYPNDAATQREVEIARERFGNIRRIVCPKDGPTNKADCLNWIYQGILLYEQETGVRFAMFVMQDSEDIVHPLSLRLFNYLIPRMDMVQLPVFPLEAPWWDFTSGHYLDEFAENHSKDMLVRERLAKTIPSAGVGCAFSRRALEAVARSKQNQLFSIDSLTEDYDFGFRLKEANLKQIFVRQELRRTVSKRSRFTGRQREAAVGDVVAVREFFPNRFWPAVRQKARWVVGIALQGWAGIGWRGDFWTRYMLYRDRKSLVTNLVNMLGYVVVLTVLGIYLHSWLRPDGYHYPPLVEEGTWVWDLIMIDTGLLIFRSFQRFFHVRRVYGWLQAFLAVPRQLWGNVINFTATCRALYLFGRYLATGRLIAWDKTAHAFPSSEQMRSYRRKLGDLLLEKRLVTLQQLEDALRRQQEENLPLGSLLVREGIVKEDDLVQVLGLQMRLERRTIDPYATPLELLALVPRRLAVRFSVFPVELRSRGQLVLAARVPLTQVQLSELQGALGRPVELCLAAKSDIAFAIRRGYEQLEQTPSDAESRRSRICDLLVSEGVLTRAQAEDALSTQRRRFARIGDILVEQGALTPEALDRAVSTYTWSPGGKLGHFLVARGFISESQLNQALETQRTRSQPIGAILVEKGFISEKKLSETLRIQSNDVLVPSV